ncbi:hypothetical protein [Jiulongibacter sp. NS-SX5]|uniref:hypothetical protein n=1 Tax=Jiulongibacter sp. NS-SX5 TaxID=3463854 RepID=UPI0040586C5C
MKLIILLFLSSLSLLAQERYYLVEGELELESSWQAALNSDEFIDIEIEKGQVKGSLGSLQLKAVYDIKNTSSGFVKGFYYSVDLGFLQRDVSSDLSFQNLTNGLSQVKRLYFYPDILAGPQWHFIEMTGDSPKTLWVRKH